MAGYYPLLEHALSIFLNCILESYNYYREFKEKILPMLEEKVEENRSLKVLQVKLLSEGIGHADIFRSLHFGVLKKHHHLRPAPHPLVDCCSPFWNSDHGRGRCRADLYDG
jgi:hypothetical protein